MKSYDELLAERDALAAQVSALLNGGNWLISMVTRLAEERIEHKLASHLELRLKKTAELFEQEYPQQCLAEIKAEAGRAGFIAGYHNMHIEFVGSLASSEGAEFAASQYAAKIRNTGTWLKDSNVNGGKRHGGE